MSEQTTTLEQDLKPALDAYGEEMSKHGLVVGEVCCRCGWAPVATRRQPRVSIGLHVRAEERKADRAYIAAAGEIIEARGKRATAAARAAARA